MLPTPSDQDPVAFGPSVAAAPSTSPSPQMLQTCNDLKIWLLAFPSLARLYSTHPSGSAANSLLSCKIGSSFCQDSGSGFRGDDSCPFRDVTVLCVPAAMKTWHLDPLTLDRLVATAIILLTQQCVVQPDPSCCRNPQNVVPACPHELQVASQRGTVQG